MSRVVSNVRCGLVLMRNYLFSAMVVSISIIGMNYDMIWLISARMCVPWVRVRLVAVVTRVSRARVLIWLVRVTSVLAAPIALLRIMLFLAILWGTGLLATTDALTVSDLMIMRLLAGTCLLGWIVNWLLICSLVTGMTALMLLMTMWVAAGVSPLSVDSMLCVDCPD